MTRSSWTVGGEWERASRSAQNVMTGDYDISGFGAVEPGGPLWTLQLRSQERITLLHCKGMWGNLDAHMVPGPVYANLISWRILIHLSSTREEMYKMWGVFTHPQAYPAFPETTPKAGPPLLNIFLSSPTSS
jgi:hypothetical protein